MGWIHNANAAVAKSAVGRYFRLDGSSHVSAMVARQLEDSKSLTVLPAKSAT